MKPCMMIVEDNDLAGTMVSTLFETLGFRVHLVPNGSLALPVMEKVRPDIVILDLELPGMTGDEIYRAMKESPEWRDTPVVAFTAHHNTPEEKLTNNFILTAYAKTHVIPEIVYKTDESGEEKDVNSQLIDEVAFALMEAGREITPEMAKWYLESRGLKANDVVREKFRQGQ